MNVIHLKDNNPKGSIQLTELADFENLWSIANRSLNDLVKENEHFLVYPPDLAQSKDKIGKLSIFNLSTRNWLGAEKSLDISTGNLMGFFRCGEKDSQTEVLIHSRFTSKNADNGAEDDWLLPYMLSKVLDFNVLENETSQKQDPLFDLLVLMFPRYLIDACQKGIFRQYVVHDYNDSRIRGVIDVNRHIRYNIPFNGKIAYRTREYSYDNPVTQLIRHTIEFIRRHKFSSVLNETDVASYVSQICDATPSYCLNDRRKILDQNRKNVNHPYLTEYTDLQKICRMILMYDESSFGLDQDEVISGVLFDGAWLWEEYLNVVLNEGRVKITHARNKAGGGCIHPLVGQNNKEKGLFYPDFYNENPGFVMDAKYKRLENKTPQADDLQQVIAYMHVLSANSGVYLYPSQNSQEPKDRLLGTLKGLGGNLYVFGFKIPTEKGSLDAFKQEISLQEADFVKFVNERMAELEAKGS